MVDYKHTNKIDKFIVQAELFADKKLQKRRFPTLRLRDIEWTKIYLKKMNELTIKAGLRIP